MAAFVLASPATAQPDRYDTGQRLRAFEAAWDQHATLDAHRRALPSLKRALSNFFGGRFTEAALMLDDARLRLPSDDEPTPARRFAESLTARPFARFVDPAVGAVQVAVKPFYDSRVPAVPGATVRLSLTGLDGKPLAAATVPAGDVPTAGSLSLADVPEGDHQLRAEAWGPQHVLATRHQVFSAAARLDARLKAVRAAADARPEAGATTETLTLQSHARTLATLAGGGVFETDLPAARLLAEAEALAAHPADRPFYTAERAGQFWLTIPVGSGAAIVRLLVPDGLSADRPAPVVVALHGAGGSENLFFDGYGHGAIVELCRKRGWLLVAPRSLGFFGGGPPVAAVLDELAKRYPVDPGRAFLVGHSMGASQAVSLAQRAPGRFAAVAALGGGGNVTQPKAFDGLPAFVAAGGEDFALGGAKALHRALEKAGATRLEWREYEAVDHIVVVQAALPDVFAWLDGVPARAR